VILPFKFPDRYEFSGERLEGGQGYVYLCRDTLLDRMVAVKVMKGVRNAAHLLRELAMIRSIRSKHVAEIYDLLSAKHSEMVGLVQEYAAGKDVEEWAQSVRTPTECLEVIHQIASGIVDIHGSMKVHRDIKPTNIKFDAEQVIKILDFGFTVAADPKAETILARGTRFYLAPEVYGTPPIRINRAIDTYAFGVTAAVICNRGELPKGLRSVPPSRTTFRFGNSKVSLPQEIVDILDATLSANPGTRPSMTDIKEIVERRLLYGKHRAVVWSSGKPQILSMPGKVLNLIKGSDEIAIEYDGLALIIRSVVGDVFINNRPAVSGDDLPGSCVVTLGHSDRGASRTFITVDRSHPGIEV
jgi:serine/threonine protein kinase